MQDNSYNATPHLIRFSPNIISCRYQQALIIYVTLFLKANIFLIKARLPFRRHVSLFLHSAYSLLLLNLSVSFGTIRCTIAGFILRCYTLPNQVLSQYCIVPLPTGFNPVYNALPQGCYFLIKACLPFRRHVFVIMQFNYIKNKSFFHVKQLV